MKIKGFNKNNSGRNNTGKITVNHIGGGNKTKYRKIDFFRTKNSTSIVTTIEHDPKRTSNIAAIFDERNKKYSYIIAPQGLKIGDIVRTGPLAQPKNGHSLSIDRIPPGSIVHNLTVNPKKGAQICRSAGTFARIMEKTKTNIRVVLNSGEQRFVDIKCVATIGRVSNKLWYLCNKNKAGRSRWMNKRPSVRGVAMNPVDHPNGGGEGKTSGKGKNPWGKPNQRGKTSKSKNNKIIKRYNVVVKKRNEKNEK